MTTNNSPMTVAKAIQMSWISIFNPAILIRLLIPVFIAIAISLFLLFWGWPLITNELVPYLNGIPLIQSTLGAVEQRLNFSIVTFLALLIFVALIFILTYFSIILLTSLILVPLLNPIIQQIYFPNLLKKSEMSLMGSLVNSVIAIVWFIGLLIVTSPLFLLVPGAQLVIPFFLNANLARRVFPYDTLQDYASISEYQRFVRAEKQSLWTVSLLTAGYFYVPIMNLIAAPMMALTFIFFSLGKIAEYRNNKIKEESK